MSQSFESSFHFGNPGSARPIEPDHPMRIVVLGNFSGSAVSLPPAERKLRRVDVDSFDEFLAKVAPVARVSADKQGGARFEVSIREQDDFHPDALYRNLSLFHELRDLRKRLLNPETFAAAAETLASSITGIETVADSSSNAPRSENTAVVESAGESDADTLERVLGQSAQRVDTSADRTLAFDIQSLIHQIVAPYIEPKPDPRLDDYLRAVDDTISGLMRGILHDQNFQDLESVWCGLHFLVSEVTLSDQVQVFVWDVTKEELMQASESESGQLEGSLLFRKLVTDREQNPFSLLVSSEVFGNEVNDLILLSRLGAVASHCGGPILATASPKLVGCDSWTDEIQTVIQSEGSAEENWLSVRTNPVAKWIGLAGPRILLRLPYGAKTNPIDSIAFEEIDDAHRDHAALLWGSASWFTATLIATSFLESGWSMQPGEHLEISDLPALTYLDDGEKLLKACSEVYLSERVAEWVLQRGLMPVLSFKNRNAARVMRMQSIASPGAALAGPWS